MVRNRPATKPPKPDAIHCTTMRPMPVVTTKVVAEAPEPDQGESPASPSPEPSVTNTRVIATAADAPAKIAAQDTAETPDSETWPLSLRRLSYNVEDMFSARAARAE